MVRSLPHDLGLLLTLARQGDRIALRRLEDLVAVLDEDDVLHRTIALWKRKNRRRVPRAAASRLLVRPFYVQEEETAELCARCGDGGRALRWYLRPRDDDSS